MNSRFAIIMVALVLGFVGFVVFSKKDEQQGGNSTGQSAQVSNHTYGEGKKKVELVEYGDFECPACTQFYPIIKQVKEKHKEDITFKFVNFPLTTIHLNAMAAHRAAEAAHKQGKFWEMHDLLYETRDSWAAGSNAGPSFESYAKQLGLDMTKYKSDVASSEVNGIIQADIKQGQKAGVTATPTFFINGKKITTPPTDVEGFTKLIEEAAKNQ